MTDKNKLLNKAVALIGRIEEKTSDLIIIINMIDYNRMAGNDSAVQDLVAEYYNGILFQSKESEEVKELKRKLKVL